MKVATPGFKLAPFPRDLKLAAQLVMFSSIQQDGNQNGICRCWETNVGQEMYKLMLIQTVTEVGSVLLVEGFHWFLSKMVDRYCKTSPIAKIVSCLGSSGSSWRFRRICWMLLAVMTLQSRTIIVQTSAL